MSMAVTSNQLLYTARMAATEFTYQRRGMAGMGWGQVLPPQGIVLGTMMGGMGMGGMGMGGGMGGMGGMGQMGGMGGMGRPGMMFSYARMNLRPQAGMTHVRVGANGVVNPRTKPTLTDWRRALRLHQPLSLKW